MSQSGISLKMLTLAQGLYAQGVREGIGWLDVSAIGKVG
jgi:hypothetical protein